MKTPFTTLYEKQRRARRLEILGDICGVLALGVMGFVILMIGHALGLG